LKNKRNKTPTELLSDFLGERVSVVTSTFIPYEREDGAVFETPIVREGVLLDFDENSLLIKPISTEPPRLISRHSVVEIELVDLLEEAMKDPAKETSH
jgi:hypothetical protein